MQFDYIFAGLGLSSMLIIDRLLDSGMADTKSILILDGTEHSEKTWCFWEKGTGKYDHLLAKTWTKGLVKTDDVTIDCLDGQFVYKCIDSVAFRNYILAKIQTARSIEFKKENLVSFADVGDSVEIVTASGTFKGKFLFNSVPSGITGTKKNPLLLQHFKGWFIKTKNAEFDPEVMTMMDFSVGQKNNTRFLYTLPFSSTEALVEYTLFSPSLLDDSEYEAELGAYLDRIGITEFEVTKTESGVIPMTTQPLWNRNTKNVLFTGTAGGWTKASTGYTFYHAMRLAENVANELRLDEPDFTHFKTSSRFTFYDRIFIWVLYHRNELGKRIFSQLFQSNPTDVLEFLNETSTPTQELKIILSCPKLPFIKAFFKTL